MTPIYGWLGAGYSRWQGALMGISSGDAGCPTRNYVK